MLKGKMVDVLVVVGIVVLFALMIAGNLWLDSMSSLDSFDPDDYYTTQATVVQCESNTVVLEDSTGNIWAMDGDKYTVGNTGQLVLCKQGTQDITDDTIVDFY